MGYYVDYDGEFKVTPSPSIKFFTELNKFCEERHDSMACPYYYVGMHLELEDETNDVFLRPDEDNDKDNCQSEWVPWLIENKFKPEGLVLNGEMKWEGEEQGDLGKIIVKDNVVTVKHAKIVWED